MGLADEEVRTRFSGSEDSPQHAPCEGGSQAMFEGNVTHDEAAGDAQQRVEGADNGHPGRQRWPAPDPLRQGAPEHQLTAGTKGDFAEQA